MKCANCQVELSPEDSFCSQCGQRVAPAAAPPAAPTGRVSVSAGELRRFEGHQDEVVKVAFSADGRQACSAGDDGAIYIWDLESGRQLRRILSVGVTSAVALSADGRRGLTFASGMHLWSLESGKEIQRFAWTAYVLTAALSRDGRRALFDAKDNAIQYWDLDSGRELQRLVGHSALIESLAFSPDGRYALSGAMEPDYSDRAVILWDLQSGRELRRPERQMMLVNGLAFSPDGRRALAGTLDANIYLWEIESGYELRRYEGHSGNVFAVAFSPDGQRFLSCSGTDTYDDDMLRELGTDNTVRLWDAERQRELHRFEGHTGNVNCIAFSPDGRTALSGSSDKTVRLWRLPN